MVTINLKTESQIVKQKTSPQGYKTQINILPFPELAQMGTEQFDQGATLLGWPKSIYCLERCLLVSLIQISMQEVKN